MCVILTSWNLPVMADMGNLWEGSEKSKFIYSFISLLMPISNFGVLTNKFFIVSENEIFSMAGFIYPRHVIPSLECLP